jgi:phage terminase small subunit
MERPNAAEERASRAAEKNTGRKEGIMGMETQLEAFRERSIVRDAYGAVQALRRIMSAFGLPSTRRNVREAEVQAMHERNERTERTESLAGDNRRLREWNDAQAQAS